MTPALIAAAITILLYFITHLVLSVWWASKTNTMLVIMETTLRDIRQDLKDHKSNSATKEEITKENQKCETERKAMWMRQDDLRIRVEKLELSK